jgi:hypothetical protein
MKKELALTIGAVANILLIYPLARFTPLDYRGIMILMLPLISIILYSTYHSATLLFNNERKKAIIFASLLVIAIIVTFQFVLLMIKLTIPIVV